MAASLACFVLRAEVRPPTFDLPDLLLAAGRVTAMSFDFRQKDDNSLDGKGKRAFPCRPGLQQAKRSDSMNKIFTCLVALALVLAASGTARADLLTNGSFQTGDLTGWTDGGNTGWNSVVGGGSDGDGFQVSNGAVGSLSLLDQTVSTFPGSRYRITGWEQNDGGGEFHVLFDGFEGFTDLFTSHSYAPFSFIATASGTSAVLELQTRDDPGFIQFDQLGVDPIPEPASLTMLAMGGVAAATGYIVRRRRRKADVG
jgi:hypothetical protein